MVAATVTIFRVNPPLKMVAKTKKWFALPKMDLWGTDFFYFSENNYLNRCETEESKESQKQRGLNIVCTNVE